MTASVTYLQREGTRTFFSWDPYCFQMHNYEQQETFRESRVDLGPLLRTRLNSDLWFIMQCGATHLDLSLGTSVDDGRPFWGAYAGAGLEQSPSEFASVFLAVRHRFLQIQSTDFGGIQVEMGFRWLISGGDQDHEQ
jgi:hypothetical protein